MHHSMEACAHKKSSHMHAAHAAAILEALTFRWYVTDMLIEL